MYVVTYVRDEGSGEALVYLPGPGEEHYGLNASTILRAGSAGGTTRCRIGRQR